MTASDSTSKSPTPAYDPTADIARALGLAEASVAAVVRLLAEGATVPFIARYRKEATAGLDEVAIRAIEDKRAYLLDLHDRKRTVLSEIDKQGKLTPELRAAIERAQTKAEVEDLYLPYKPKRRTRAMIAKERGLEPLADLMWSQAKGVTPSTEAARFVDVTQDVPDVDAALSGARDICAERISELANVRRHLRESIAKHGLIAVQKTREHAEQVTKFDMYAEFSEPLAKIPSHRFLAIRRGEAEGVLRSNVQVDTTSTERLIAGEIGLDRGNPWGAQLEQAAADALKRMLLPSAELDVTVEVKLRADAEAIGVFADNLKQLLLAAPFGAKPVLGIDPGQRTGCKCAVVDATGRLLEHATIYLVQGDESLRRARETLSQLLAKHRPRAVAVGNGTHGRETEAFVRQVLGDTGLSKDGTFCVAVSEAGASVYSASDVAREEFPDLDLTIRGAVSIARRLQDPLSELVKVDAKSIGVGQYQHDVYQPLLTRKLDEVVESCVNQVGVEVNTASAPLLAHVSGLGPSVAKKIVAHRDQHGAFGSRKQLLDVSGLGPSTFQQAAGFLRIHGADNPLDASAVHPERYALVEQMARDLGVPVASMVCNVELLKRLDLKRYEGGDVGQYTLRDILSELQKPGRDPRANFEPPKFRDDVQKLEDLKLGMELEGVVTNVTAFGAFVDVGVHQDGLVHVSQLADRFVKNPADVVKVGDKLKVRVLEVDLQRRRIALSARKDAGGGAAQARPSGSASQGQAAPRGQAAQGTARHNAPPPRGQARPNKDAPLSHNPFADRFRKGS